MSSRRYPRRKVGVPPCTFWAKVKNAARCTLRFAAAVHIFAALVYYLISLQAFYVDPDTPYLHLSVSGVVVGTPRS